MCVPSLSCQTDRFLVQTWLPKAFFLRTDRGRHVGHVLGVKQRVERRALTSVRERAVAIAPRRYPVAQTACEGELGCRIRNAFDVVLRKRVSSMNCFRAMFAPSLSW